MRKKLLVATLLAVIMLFSLGGVAMAADPTDVSINWDGSGGISGSVDTGDAVTSFGTFGDTITGEFTSRDSNDNPYTYGVDTFTTKLEASVENGQIESETERLTSKESMYGAPGQYTYSFLGVDGGSGSMAIRSVSNYASMKDPTYGYQLSGGHNIVADADFYVMTRYVEASDGDYGVFSAVGDGQATLDSMVSEMSATGVRLGWGGGCYTDANFNATGTGGSVLVEGGGGNSVSGMGVSIGGGTLQVIVDWLNNVSIGDYSLTAN